MDFLYFSHADWPRGRGMAVGHLLLTSLFVGLVVTYLTRGRMPLVCLAKWIER